MNTMYKCFQDFKNALSIKAATFLALIRLQLVDTGVFYYT